MSTRFYKPIQGPLNHTKFLTRFEELQDEIVRKTGVRCRVFEEPHKIELQTVDWRDYYLARDAIKGSVTKEIVRAA